MTNDRAPVRRPLLGALAHTPWLAQHGEVLAVQALQILLAEQGCRSALARLLRASLGIAVPEHIGWRAEDSRPPHGRPDLSTDGGPDEPRVIIEAKFAASLSLEQVDAYLHELEHPPSSAARALVLLVPPHRVGTARDRLQQAVAQHPNTSVVTGVFTWDLLLQALTDGATDETVAEDLRQLAGLCDAYAGMDILPFTDDEERQWAATSEGSGREGAAGLTRHDDLLRIADRVTAALSPAGSRLLPMSADADDTGDPAGYRYRYVPLFPEQSRSPYFSIGVRVPRSGSGTPMWLRFHRQTAQFADVATRVRDAIPEAEQPAGGHLYLPLHVATGLSGADVVEDVVRQVHRYFDTAGLRRPVAAADAPDAAPSPEAVGSPQTPGDRARHLAAVAAAHAEWVARYENVPPRNAGGYAEGSDYPEHYLDVDATPEQEAEFQRLLQQHLHREEGR